MVERLIVGDCRNAVFALGDNCHGTDDASNRVRFAVGDGYAVVKAAAHGPFTGEDRPLDLPCVAYRVGTLCRNRIHHLFNGLLLCRRSQRGKHQVIAQLFLRHARRSVVAHGLVSHERANFVLSDWLRQLLGDRAHLPYNVKPHVHHKRLFIRGALKADFPPLAPNGDFRVIQHHRPYVFVGIEQ